MFRHADRLSLISPTLYVAMPPLHTLLIFTLSPALPPRRHFSLR